MFLSTLVRHVRITDRDRRTVAAFFRSSSAISLPAANATCASDCDFRLLLFLSSSGNFHPRSTCSLATTLIASSCRCRVVFLALAAY